MKRALAHLIAGMFYVIFYSALAVLSVFLLPGLIGKLITWALVEVHYDPA